jgi:hypothetical protein
MLESSVLVREDGAIESTNRDVDKLIRLLGLDDPEYREFRMLWIGIIASQAHSPKKLCLR